MFDDQQGGLRVLLEVVPRPSLLAAIDEDANLAGNPNAAEQLSRAGMVVDADWTALRLGPFPSGGKSTLARRPRFDMVRETVNKVGDVVNRVGGALPIVDVQVPTWSPPERRTVLFRASLPRGDAAEQALAVATERAEVVGVYNDPPVALAQRRHTDASHGNAERVGELMSCDTLRDQGLTGNGVVVAVVDAGINMAYLHGRGRRNELDESLSYVAPTSDRSAGDFPIGHGTLCAFQVGIAAPDATLADHAVILDPAETDGAPLMQAWLSDIEPGYVKLHRHLSELDLPDRRLVVSNSWAMIHPDWDYPSEHVQNFSDNPAHPFNRMVRALIDLGADVLFAAGNCGQPYPVGGCGFRSQPICGANALEEVITVGAVDIDGERLGYSSQGPGRIVAEKPDLCGYSHYAGSEIYYADWGTSTACPGVAGVVAALRSRYSPAELPPRALKDALLRSAHPADGPHSPDIGYGVIDPARTLERLRSLVGGV